MDSLLYKAKCACSSGFYEEMVLCMKHVILVLSSDADIPEEVRNLFVTAYKNYLGQLRYSSRVVEQIVAYETKRDHSEAIQVASDYAKEIDAQIVEVCHEVENIVQPLIYSATSERSKAFWLKVKGDFKRYLSELNIDQKQLAIIEAMDSYQEALKLPLKTTDPLTMAITLNMAILHYDVLRDQDKAISILQGALATAKKAYPDPKTQPLVVDLLTENLTAWTG